MTEQPASDSDIEDLLLQVLEAPDADQESVLAALCAREQGLAERLQTRWRIMLRFGLATSAGEVPLRRLGEYRVVRTLGRGGMGIVYEAQHASLGRRVALKCIRPELLADERTRERFRRETLSLARLQHPGLCTLYESGEADGQPFLAMQFVDGESLDVQLARARAAGRVCWSSRGDAGRPGPDSGTTIARGVRDTIALVAQLARAVDVMHGAGIVHRDLKPANVMVTAAGPVLIDFGLARNFADATASLTLSNDVVGTPAYMAPEQVEPRGRTADARTDVHALGAILYECLALRPPLVGVGREDTYRRILREEPVELRHLQPAAGADLAAVVHRALAKEPHRRFASAGEFAEELERVLRDEPTRTRPPGPVRRLAVWARQRPATVASLATLVAASCLGLLVAFMLGRRAQRLESINLSLRATDHDPAQGLLHGADGLDQGGGEPARSACYEALAHLRQVADWRMKMPATAVAASGDGSVLVAGDWSRGAWLVREGVAKYLEGRGRARSVAVDAERGRVLVVGHLLRAMLFDLDGKLIKELVAQPPEVFETVPEGAARLAYGCLEGGIQGDRIHLLTRDGRVRLFDLDGVLRADKQVEAPLPPGGWAGAARERATGLVAFGGADGTVAVFAADGTVRIPPRRVHDGPVRFVQFSPDGRSLLVAPGHVRIWSDLEPRQTAADFSATILALDGQDLPPLEGGHTAPLTSASWSPDGKSVLTTSEDGKALIWQVGRPRALPTVLPHDKPVDGGMFFANGRRVVTRMDNADPVQWTVDGQRIGELRGHLGGCYAVTAVGDGERLLTGSLDSRLLLWDARSAWCDEWRVEGGLHTAFFADDGAVWVQAVPGLRLLRREASEPVAVPAPDERVARRADPAMKLVVPFGTRLIEVSGEGGAVVFSWGEGGRRQLLPEQGTDPAKQIVLASVAVDERTGRVALGGCNGEILVLDGEGVVVDKHDLAMPGMAVMGLGWLPDGAMLAATRDGLLLRIGADRVIARLRALNTYAFRMAMTPDGRVAAIADGNRRVHVIDAATAAPLLTLPPMGGAIRTLSFAQDGRRLLVATSNGDVRVWPIELSAAGADMVQSSPYRAAIEAARARFTESR